MKKMSSTIKKSFTFLILALTIPWLNISAFFASATPYFDEESLSLLEEDPATIFENFYLISLWAFILTYIIAKQVINKKTNKWLWRIVWYIITDIILFFALCFI